MCNQYLKYYYHILVIIKKINTKSNKINGVSQSIKNDTKIQNDTFRYMIAHLNFILIKNIKIELWGYNGNFLDVWGNFIGCIMFIENLKCKEKKEEGW